MLSPARPRFRILLAALFGVALVAAACSSDDSTDDPSSDPGTGESSESPSDDSGSETSGDLSIESDQTFAEAAWDIQPGVGGITVTGTEPGEPLTLYNSSGQRLVTVTADDLGQVAFPYLPKEHTVLEAGPEIQLGGLEGGLVEPGVYEIRNDDADPPTSSGPVTVLAVADVPDAEFYEAQELDGLTLGILGDVPEGATTADGFGYIETRDGTLLSTMVRFPDPAIYGEGPWPTVIEMSGYGVSNPDGEEPGVRIARTLGYATVSVNLRGSGCSGGIFDVFNRAQHADGYDVVEAVARQPWVLHNSPGLVGLSYSGITQLYTAATRPPSLAAITPQSVITDPWVQQWPGGTYNAGFTRRWLEERDRQAAPNGQSWTAGRIEAGDEICEAHQDLRNLNIDFESFGRSLTVRPEASNARDIRLLAEQIEVPTYLTGAFHDEQTGAQFPDLFEPLANASPLKISMWSGRHPDGYSQSNINRFYEFLEFYVARRVPAMNPLVRAGLAPELAKSFNIEDAEIEGDRWVEEYGDDYDAALAAYEAEDPIRVIYELGAGANEVGEPVGTMTRTYQSWPPANTEILTFELAPDGALVSPTEADGLAFPETEVAFVEDPGGVDQNFLAEGSGGLLSPTWEFEWQRFGEQASAVFDTAPLTEDILLNGQAEASLWVSVDQPEADLQVTLSEVRPDGIEYLLQTGWLRLGHRATLDEDVRDARPTRTWDESDFAPMPTDGTFELARVAIPSIGAPVRAGSVIRMTVSSPGRDRAEWTFEDPHPEAVTNYAIALGGATDSRLDLTVTLGEDVPEGLAPCPGLRGQACRPVN